MSKSKYIFTFCLSLSLALVGCSKDNEVRIYEVMKLDDGEIVLSQEIYVVWVKEQLVFRKYASTGDSLLLSPCIVHDKNNWICYWSKYARDNYYGSSAIYEQMVDGVLADMYPRADRPEESGIHYVSWYKWWWYKILNFLFGR